MSVEYIFIVAIKQCPVSYRKKMHYSTIAPTFGSGDAANLDVLCNVAEAVH